MQVVLGTAAAKTPLDDFIERTPLDEIEIVDANGTALAYLVPVPRPGDETYAKFESVFQQHAATLASRAASPSHGICTEELLTKLNALPGKADDPCDLP